MTGEQVLDQCTTVITLHPRYMHEKQLYAAAPNSISAFRYVPPPCHPTTQFVYIFFVNHDFYDFLVEKLGEVMQRIILHK